LRRICRRRLDSPPFGKILMKLGLALIVVGHLNFIFGAIVHGLVLRHVSELKDTVSVHYSMANITAVASAILKCSACLSVANVYIESVFFPPQRWALLTLGIINAMLSAACTVGTAVSIIITLANQGRTLLSSCTYTNLELIQISHECPFDPTRIYKVTDLHWSDFVDQGCPNSGPLDVPELQLPEISDCIRWVENLGGCSSGTSGWSEFGHSCCRWVFAITFIP
uniref:Transmembrane protein 54 n=1 Tax=Leptobrachium leishanense TaxID=445787 RepID=A0A8C5M244_9ANUR